MKFTKRGKIITSGLLAGMLLSGNALAASSYAEIDDHERYAEGADIMITDGDSVISGKNYSSSTNDLYVELRKSNTAGSGIKDDILIRPGRSDSKYVNDLKDGEYYVGLNPKGPRANGVNGEGKITD